MYAGLKPELVCFLCCHADCGILEVAGIEADAGGAIVHGSLACKSCARRYPVRDGIVIMGATDEMHPDSRYEREQRDREAVQASFDWETLPWSRAEMLSTLAALRPISGTVLLELGCGCGRYTHLLARQAAALIAVDFSIQSLRQLATRLGPADPVALVCADIMRFGVAGRAFDRVLSTATSNLPTPRHRDAMYRLAGRALVRGGKFVFSAHYLGLRERFHRQAPKSGYYESNRIYRYLFGRRELRDEVRPHFYRVCCRRIQISLPFASRLGLPPAVTSRIAEFIPGLNRFASLLLVTTREPCETGGNESGGQPGTYSTDQGQYIVERRQDQGNG
jgi:SAM-dependent methyltransferase